MRTALRTIILAIREWLPSELFRHSEVGVWYDVSDWANTCFQDSAGTTAAAIESPVGLILDKSKGLVLGAELVVNGDFSDGTTGWTLVGAASIAAGVVSLSGGDQVSQTGGEVVGKAYLLTFTVVTTNGSDLGVYSAGGVGGGAFVPTLGANKFLLSGTAGGGVQIVAFGFAGTIDNISVRELPGNHATQATAASRPTLSARVNLLTKTEQFDDAAWSKLFAGTGSVPVVTSGFTDPEGGATAWRVQANRGAGDTAADYSIFRRAITLASGIRSAYVKSNTGIVQTFRLVAADATQAVTATTEWVRVQLPASTGGATGFNISNYGPDLGTRAVDILVWHPSLVPADQASLPYQRVDTASVYDTVGFPTYLKFDGVDDSLATGSIDFSAGDKMSVWAGVRKLVDASYGCIAELSTSSLTNNSVFNVFGPSATPGGTASLGIGFKGTVSSAAEVTTGYAAPTTRVMTGIGSISTDVSILRINGVQAATSATDQGTGNFGNYPLYIGRRGGTTLPFNGHLYSLIVRAAQSTDAQIVAAETYVNGKTGAF